MIEDFLKRWAWLISGVWALVILVLSITPGQELPEVNLWEIDKVVHVVVYGILVYLLCWAMMPTGTAQSQTTSVRYRYASKALIIGILYGIGIEFVQGNWIPDRFFDLFDILANIIGSLAGLITCIFHTKWISK